MINGFCNFIFKVIFVIIFIEGNDCMSLKAILFIVVSVLVLCFILFLPALYYAIFNPTLYMEFIEGPIDFWWWKFYYPIVSAGGTGLIIYLVNKKFKTNV